jgi:hypothetical protein
MGSDGNHLTPMFVACLALLANTACDLGCGGGMYLRSDVLDAVDRLRSPWEVAREIQHLPSHLREGEIVVALAAGVYGVGTGLMVLTDRRVLVIREGRASQASEGFPFEQLCGVEWTPTSVHHGTITISDATRTTEFTQVIAGEASELMGPLRSVTSIVPPINQRVAPGQPSTDANISESASAEDPGRVVTSKHQVAS